MGEPQRWFGARAALCFVGWEHQKDVGKTHAVMWGDFTSRRGRGSGEISMCNVSLRRSRMLEPDELAGGDIIPRQVDCELCRVMATLCKEDECGT